MSKIRFTLTKVRPIESTNFYHNRTGNHARALLNLYKLLSKFDISYVRDVEIRQRCLAITTLKNNDEFVVCIVELERVN